MSRGRALRRVALLIPTCGVVIAALFTLGWVAIGRPQIAEGATWFKVEKVGAVHYSGSPTKPFFFLAVGNDARRERPRRCTRRCDPPDRRQPDDASGLDDRHPA